MASILNAKTYNIDGSHQYFGWTKIATGSGSNVAEIAFEDLGTEFHAFKVLLGVTISDDGAYVLGRMSVGSSYYSGTSDYRLSRNDVEINGTPTINYGNDHSIDHMRMHYAFGNATDEYAYTSITLFNLFAGTSCYPFMMNEGVRVGGTGISYHERAKHVLTGETTGQTQGATVDGFKFYPDVGNFALYEYALYGHAENL